MDSSAYLIWDSNVIVISNTPRYKEHKKNYSLIKRIGMNIADSMKIMSVAHIRIIEKLKKVRTPNKRCNQQGNQWF
jgi:hypothetical protein